MLCSPSITLSTSICSVIGLAWVSGNLEELGNDFRSVRSDVVSNDLAEKRSLISKQAMLLRTWKELGNKSLKDYLKSFRRREYFGKRAMIGGGRWGKRSETSKFVFMGKRPRPLRMGKRSSGYLNHDNLDGQEALKKHQRAKEWAKGTYKMWKDLLVVHWAGSHGNEKTLFFNLRTSQLFH